MTKEQMTYFHNSKASRSFESNQLLYLRDFVPGDQGVEPGNLNAGLFLCFYGGMTHSATRLREKLKNPVAFICIQSTRHKIWKTHYWAHSEYILFVVYRLG